MHSTETIMPQSTNTIRTGSLVMCPQNCTARRVAKVLNIVERRDETDANSELVKIALVKLHYNGYLFTVPVSQLRKATDVEKREDKKNENYWRNHTPGSYKLGRIYFVDKPQMFSNY
tara:strand:+ start:480 stop:830 length:351 start_codon:yes stop_codon:yes gene_type:complete